MPIGKASFERRRTARRTSGPWSTSSSGSSRRRPRAATSEGGACLDDGPRRQASTPAKLAGLNGRRACSGGPVASASHNSICSPQTSGRPPATERAPARPTRQTLLRPRGVARQRGRSRSFVWSGMADEEHKREPEAREGRRRRRGARAPLDADAALLTEYRGLDVGELADLRRALRAAGGDYKIYKNTLVRFAARDLGLDIEDMLIGPTAIAFVAERGSAGDPSGGQGAARLRPHQPEPGDQGRRARRQAAHAPRTSGRWPTSRPARCCSPAWPAAWPPRSSSSPACSRRCPATSPTA